MTTLDLVARNNAYPLVAHAQSELARVGMPNSGAMLAIVERFTANWGEGEKAAPAREALARLLAGKPIV